MVFQQGIYHRQFGNFFIKDVFLVGVVKNITVNQFPKQGQDLGKRVEVCFHYDDDNIIYGSIVRDDIEEPFKGIIALDDGRYILTTECQYSPIEGTNKPQN